jgi:pimeloyl-ACP methyl ester carboxylesterase
MVRHPATSPSPALPDLAATTVAPDRPAAGRKPPFRGRIIAVLFPILAASGAMTGCAPRDSSALKQTEQGLIWMFPGVEGGAWALTGARDALRDAGVRAEIRTYEWNRPLGFITNLVEYQENRDRASEIARQISDFRILHPRAPIDLIGYSGGGGMALMVVEALPVSVRLRHVILAQPAVSPDYDLTEALRRIDGRLVNFCSPYDVFLLGLGTTLIGTMDRQHVASAGKNGFNLPLVVAEPALAAHFEQQTWSPKALPTGHVGTHYGILLYQWNQQYVAPYLLPGLGVSSLAKR